MLELPHNNAMSALIGFGKITHELKNRQVARRHLNLCRSPIPANCSERKMVGVWWGWCSSSPEATSSHTPARLSCSVVKLELSKCWKLLEGTGDTGACRLLQDISHLMLRAHTVHNHAAKQQGTGEVPRAAKAEVRKVKMLQKSFLPNCFQVRRSLLSASLLDSREETSLLVCRQLDTSSWWPLQKTEIWFSSHLQYGCHSSVSHLMAEEELLWRGVSRGWPIWPE